MQTEEMENKERKTNKNMKKQLIRLTEGDLHRIIKESVNRILKEGNNDAYKGKDYAKKVWDYEKTPRISDEYVAKMRNNELLNKKLSDYAYGSFGGDEQMDDDLMTDWENMCNKLLKYKNPGEALDKLIKRNPIFKKWYENNHKKREKESSWRQFDEYQDELNDLYDSEKEELYQPSPFATDDSYANDDFRHHAWN